MPEQIGVFLLFVVFVVFNLIAGAVKRRRQREAAEKERQRQLPPPRAPVPLTRPPRVVVRPPSIEEAPPPPVVVRRPPTRGRVPVQGKRRLELRRDELRRAIVLMTVLGPPRALEHEAKEGGGGR
jgi:hypothetical protein